MECRYQRRTAAGCRIIVVLEALMISELPAEESGTANMRRCKRPILFEATPNRIPELTSTEQSMRDLFGCSLEKLRSNQHFSRCGDAQPKSGAACV
jgi:hypothetical protein